MIQRVVDTIGLMVPGAYSLQATLERFIPALELEIRHQGRLHRIGTRRLRARPYDVLRAVSPYRVVLNHGSRAHLHYNSYLLTVAPSTYLLNDVVSFLAHDKNATYGHMTRLGFSIPPTAAIPALGPGMALVGGGRNEAGVRAGGGGSLFRGEEVIDLEELGAEIGFPAYLKPQVGDQWGEAHLVRSHTELHEAFVRSGSKPMNLQRAVEHDEFISAMGIGPQVIPMHVNPEASDPLNRFLRSPAQAVEHTFLRGDTFEEVSKITKVANAFFNWDHNTCEVILDAGGRLHPIDFANVGPRSSLLELQYYFPDVVKSVAKWLIFNAVTGRKKPALGHDWGEYFNIVEEAHTDGWSYRERLRAFEELADRHFDTRGFEAFCSEHLKDFDERAKAFFESPAYGEIIDTAVNLEVESPERRHALREHYRGLTHFWCQCESARLSPKG